MLGFEIGALVVSAQLVARLAVRAHSAHDLLAAVGGVRDGVDPGGQFTAACVGGGVFRVRGCCVRDVGDAGADIARLRGCGKGVGGVCRAGHR